MARAGASSGGGGGGGGKADVVQLKLLLIGDSAVGKTSLLLRYMNDSFSTTFVTTIGIDFKVKTMSLDAQPVRLQIWDTAGQERFRTITTSYFRGAQGILLCFDLTNRATFESCGSWVRQVAEHCSSAGSGSDVALVLVGTKADADRLQVSEVEAQALAAQHGMRFFATSAKFNSNVSEAFDALARGALAKSLAASAALTRPASDANIVKPSAAAAAAAGEGAGGKGCGAC